MLPTLTTGGAANDERYAQKVANLISNVNITKLTLGPGWKGTITVTGNQYATLPFKGNTNLLSVSVDSAAVFTNVMDSAGAVSLATVEGIPITKGGDFQGCNKLASVTFPDTWNHNIPASTFDNCTVLKSVKFPEVSGPGTGPTGSTTGAGYAVIGKYAFRNTPLTEIKMEMVYGAEEGKAYIDDEAFGNTLEIVTIKTLGHGEAIDIRKSLKGKSTIVTVDLNLNTGAADNAGGYNPTAEAFMGCANLKNVTIKGMERVEDNVFNGCAKLSSFDFTNIWYLGYGAFYGTSMLETVDLTNSGNKGKQKTGVNGTLTHGLQALEVVKGTFLGSPKYPNEEVGAFEKSGVKKVILPAGVLQIEGNTFRNCVNLESVTVTGTGLGEAGKGYWIYDNAFAGCTKLKIFGNASDFVAADVAAGTPAGPYYGKEVVVIHSDADTTSWYDTSAPHTGNFAQLGKAVFKGCTSIKEVVFSTGHVIEAYSDDLFDGCTGIKKLTVTGVGFQKATSGGIVCGPGRLPLKLSNLETVVWNCTTAIPPGTFLNVPNLTTLFVNKTIVDAGNSSASPSTLYSAVTESGAFVSAPKLATLYLYGESQQYPDVFVNLPDTFKTVIVSDTTDGAPSGLPITIGAQTSGAAQGKPIFPKSIKYVEFRNVMADVSYSSTRTQWESPFYGLTDYGVGVSAPIISGGVAFNEGYTGNELKYVDVGPKVTNLNETVSNAWGSSKLEAFNVDPDNERYGSDAGVLYTKASRTAPLTSLARYPQGKKAQSYSIPSKVNIIQNASFANNRYIEELTIPKSVYAIGTTASPFSGNANLITINYYAERAKLGVEDGTAFPATIGEDGVADQDWDTSDSSKGKGSGNHGAFNICEGVIDIPKGLLGSAHNLIKTITIPLSVQIIPFGGSYHSDSAVNPFSNLPNLTTVYFNAKELLGSTVDVEDGRNYNIFKRLDTTAQAALRTIIIGDNVTYIPVGTFSDAKNVNTITIPKNVKVVDSYAFQNCNGLESLVIQAPASGNRLRIQNYAFNGCDGPNAVTFNSDDVIMDPMSFDVGVGVSINLKGLYEGPNGGTGKYYYSKGVDGGTWNKAP
jgi:hypothetical protein